MLAAAQPSDEKQMLKVKGVLRLRGGGDNEPGSSSDPTSWIERLPTEDVKKCVLVGLDKLSREDRIEMAAYITDNVSDTDKDVIIDVALQQLSDSRKDVRERSFAWSWFKRLLGWKGMEITGIIALLGLGADVFFPQINERIGRASIVIGTTASILTVAMLFVKRSTGE